MARVAFLVDSMFEDSEFQVPYDRLRAAGHEPLIVGLSEGKRIEGKKGKVVAEVDESIENVSAEDFEALVIPGGYSPDLIRTHAKMVELTRRMFSQGKPVAAICHAGWMLAEAGIVRGRTVTSWPSIKTDLINAGASWVDREVVEDGNLITSRKPEDLEAFCDTLLEQIDELGAGASRPPLYGEPDIHPVH